MILLIIAVLGYIRTKVIIIHFWEAFLILLHKIKSIFIKIDQIIKTKYNI